jgi:hypothetical protein
MTEPSELPPNASVSELNAEIDRARHEAAHTVTALVRKFDRPALHKPLAKALPVARRTRDATPHVPWQVWVAVLFLLLRWWRKRRSARHS